jgi:hypothetical protein
MVYNDVHLSTTRSFLNQDAQNRSTLIVEAFISCCKNLDASILEPFLEENDVFEEKNKYLFLAGLKALFDSYKSKRYLSLDVYEQEGTCQSCVKGKVVKVFTVVLTGRELFRDQFAFVIDIRNELLTDIYQCRLFCKMQG